MDSKIGGATLFVKKIASLNPTRREFISLEDALTRYSYYLLMIEKYQTSAKSFKEWLRSEI